MTLDLNTVHHGDCLDLMPLIPSGSVDMILCDLPYGTTACAWDAVIPFEPLWDQYRRIIKPNGAIVLTASQPFTTALIVSAQNWFKYCWVWEKTRVGDIFNAKNKPLKQHEDVCVFSPGTTANKSDRRMSYFPQGLSAIEKTVSNKDTVRAFFATRPSHQETYTQTAEGYPTSVLKFPSEANAVHPTQKPVALWEYLIRTYTQPGETVLDNCLGSGTTAIACMNTGRQWIGIEREAKYVEVARRRIADHKGEARELENGATQLGLFGVA